jgi:hypothetical protein
MVSELLQCGNALILLFYDSDERRRLGEMKARARGGLAVCAPVARGLYDPAPVTS